MKSRNIAITAGGLALLGVGWYLFRPELLFVDRSVNEAFPATYVGPAATSGPLLAGSFAGLAHPTKGTAAVLDAGGGRVLRLTGFETSNGPDVRVLLVAAPAVTDSETVKSAAKVELGALKGNVGDQNYDIPAGTDLDRYRSVVIWCNRFGVSFGSASLAPAGAAGSEPVALGRGSFRGIAHETVGTAGIYRLANGDRVLRLTGFETSNGPDVRVILVAAPDAADSETVKKAGYVELGALKGNVGDQNYDIPAGVDLDTHRAVTIWCNRFGVNFGTAPLS